MAERVIEAREYLGLSQQEAADLIGISLAELQQIEVKAIHENAQVEERRLEHVRQNSG